MMKMLKLLFGNGIMVLFQIILDGLMTGKKTIITEERQPIYTPMVLGTVVKNVITEDM